MTATGARPGPMSESIREVLAREAAEAEARAEAEERGEVAPAPGQRAGMTATDPRPATRATAPSQVPPAGPDPLSGHHADGNQIIVAAEGTTSPQARPATEPKTPSPAGNGTAPPARFPSATRTRTPEGHQFGQGQDHSDSQMWRALADDIPGGQPIREIQADSVAGEQAPPAPAREDAAVTDAPSALAASYTPFLASPVLAMYAEIIDDLESSRIANENRLRQFVRADDGERMPPDVCDPEDKAVTAKLLRAVRLEAGLAAQQARNPRRLPGWMPEVQDLCELVVLIQAAEHEATLTLRRTMRKHPLWQWAKGIAGLGDKQFARFLGVTGDPYVRGVIDYGDGITAAPYPRTLGQWRAYCGHGDPGRRPFTGMSQADAKALGNRTAKMRAHLIAEQFMKSVGGTDAGGAVKPRSPYRDVYEAARETYSTRVHEAECRNRSRFSPNGCGIREHPEWGEPGSPWRDGHQHAAALRLVAKTFLDDLYAEAKRLHEEAGR